MNQFGFCLPDVYRVFHLIVDLGWIDLYLYVPPFGHVQHFQPNLASAQAKSSRQRSTENPGQSKKQGAQPDKMNHPVDTCSKIALTDGFGPNLHLKGSERVGVGVGCLRVHGTGVTAQENKH